MRADGRMIISADSHMLEPQGHGDRWSDRARQLREALRVHGIAVDWNKEARFHGTDA